LFAGKFAAFSAKMNSSVSPTMEFSGGPRRQLNPWGLAPVTVPTTAPRLLKLHAPPPRDRAMTAATPIWAG
jgi:hypothetical protein